MRENGNAQPILILKLRESTGKFVGEPVFTHFHSWTDWRDWCEGVFTYWHLRQLLTVNSQSAQTSSFSEQRVSRDFITRSASAAVLGSPAYFPIPSISITPQPPYPPMPVADSPSSARYNTASPLYPNLRRRRLSDPGSRNRRVRFFDEQSNYLRLNDDHWH